MYGKIFESMFQGSMVGSGSPTFAVWAYVIANMRADAEVGAQVDLNPKLLAFILGEKEGVIEEVIKGLCSPDKKSTSKQEDGRRLVRLGEFAFRVVNGAKYMAIRSAEERREYNRLAKRKERAAGKRSKPSPGEPGFVKALNNGDEQQADRILESHLPQSPATTAPEPEEIWDDPEV